MLVGILHNILPTLLDEKIIVTKSADIYSTNVNAIDEIFLTFNFQVFIFSVVPLLCDTFNFEILIKFSKN